jgi:hypothetical protein
MDYLEEMLCSTISCTEESLESWEKYRKEYADMCTEITKGMKEAWREFDESRVNNQSNRRQQLLRMIFLEEEERAKRYTSMLGEVRDTIKRKTELLEGTRERLKNWREYVAALPKEEQDELKVRRG